MAHDWEPGMGRKVPNKRQAERTVDHLQPEGPLPLRVVQLPDQGNRVEDVLHSVQAGLCTDVCDLLEETAGVDDDGYIRLTPSDGGKTWFIVYLWRWGQWRGHYVLVSIERYNLARGLQILYRKVAEVRDGTRQPSLDRYYNNNPR